MAPRAAPSVALTRRSPRSARSRQAPALAQGSLGHSTTAPARSRSPSSTSLPRGSRSTSPRRLRCSRSRSGMTPPSRRTTREGDRHLRCPMASHRPLAPPPPPQPLPSAASPCPAFLRWCLWGPAPHPLYAVRARRLPAPVSTPYDLLQAVRRYSTLHDPASTNPPTNTTHLVIANVNLAPRSTRSPYCLPVYIHAPPPTIVSRRLHDPDHVYSRVIANCTLPHNAPERA